MVAKTVPQSMPIWNQVCLVFQFDLSDFHSSDIGSSVDANLELGLSSISVV